MIRSKSISKRKMMKLLFHFENNSVISVKENDNLFRFHAKDIHCIIINDVDVFNHDDRVNRNNSIRHTHMEEDVCCVLWWTVSVIPMSHIKTKQNKNYCYSGMKTGVHTGNDTKLTKAKNGQHTFYGPKCMELRLKSCRGRWIDS